MRYSLLVAGALTLAATTAFAQAGEDTLAIVNGTEITEADINQQLGNIPPNFLAAQGDTIRRNLLDRMIEQELMLQQARKMNVSEKPDFKDQLENAKRALMLNFVVLDVMERELTEEKLQKAYMDAKPELAQPMVKARHILVESEAEANKLIAELNKGADFEKLATEHSKGPSAPRGGDLGWFAAGDMVPTFSEAAFAMKEGEISGKPVQTRFGWHVIKVEERNENAMPPFEEVEGQLREQLSQKVLSDYIDNLKRKSTIVYTNAE